MLSPSEKDKKIRQAFEDKSHLSSLSVSQCAALTAHGSLTLADQARTLHSRRDTNGCICECS